MFKFLRSIRPDTVFIFVPASIFLALGIYLFIDTFVRNVSIFPLGLSTVLPPVLIVLGLIGVGVAYFVEKESRFRRESEEKLRNLIESVPVGIEVSTPKGEIIEANSALIKLFGYGSKEELLSKPVSSHYYDPGDREIFVESLERDGIVRDFEVKLNRKDGEECWGSISSVREEGEGGYRYINVIQDITERKRAEDVRRESDAKYRKVINTTSEGFWKFNNNAQIVEVNEAFLGMVGYDLDEVRGRSVYDFVKDESMETMKKQVSRIPASDHRRYELVLKSKEDEGVHVICNGTTIWDKDGKPMGAFAFITDITDSGDKG